MKKIKPKEDEVQIELTKVSREPLLQNGIDIDDFDAEGFIKQHAEKIDSIGDYLVWHKGKPEFNHNGGRDVIAFAYQDHDGVIRGWVR